MNNYEILSKDLEYFLKGNKYAISFCLDFFFICQIWDDLIDKDNPITDDDISLAFKVALIDMPKNQFYRHYFDELNPMVMNTILKWHDANKLEDGDFNDISKAYMLRAGIYEIFNYCAYLIGGYEWSKKVGADMRRMYGERLGDLYKEIKNA